MAPQDVACFANCLLCDSFFVVTVGEADFASFRGRKGQKQQEALLEQMQVKQEASRREMLGCPTCTVLVTGRSWEDLMSDKWAESVLTPCVKVTCTEEELDIPLYLNAARGNGKPKWKLIQGVGRWCSLPLLVSYLCAGPTTFEMARSKDGCIFKKSLREAGVSEGDVYDHEAEAMTMEASHTCPSRVLFRVQEHGEIVRQCAQCARSLINAELETQFYSTLQQHKPVYSRDNWHAVNIH